MSAPSGSRLREIVAGFPDRKVVVFGDMVLDEFLHGRIDRVSREAPVLILEYEGVVRVPGGGGNAAANAAALGGTVLPVGCVGDDGSGVALRDWYRRRGIDDSGLVREPSRTTPTKTRVLAGSSTSVQQQVVRIDRNVGGEIPEAAHRQLEARLRERLEGADALLVSDYGHGCIGEELLQRFEELAARPGLVTLVDSRRRLDRFRGMTAVTPNLEEAGGALGRSVPDEEEAVAQAARDLRERLAARHLAITRGSRGMTVLGPGTPATHLPVFGTDQVADVTGAGDTVIATFSLALASGADTVEAAHLANVAAGLAVLKRGTATVSREELLAALEGDTGGA
jgi:rfaE bifunctional protein kinase chain/domain